MDFENLGFDAGPSPAAAAARHGDFSELADRVERGRWLSGEEREVIAKILRGEITRAKGRPKSKDKSRLDSAMNFVLLQSVLNGFDPSGTDALASMLEEKFDVSRTTAVNQIVKWRGSVSFKIAEIALLSGALGDTDDSEVS